MLDAATLTRMRDVPVPDQMRYLPRDPVRGVPVPWFVDVDPETQRPEFRLACAHKRQRARDEGRCWVCGRLLFRQRVFVLGPMCGLNRVSSEPPCHLPCAEYSVRACPFLARPAMERRPGLAPELMERTSCDGVAIMRNPGCAALWEAHGDGVVEDGLGGWLFDVGVPVAVSWWAEGRPATRAEVLTSILTGLPHLIHSGKMPVDPQQPGTAEVWAHVARQWVALEPWLPATEGRP